MLEDQYDTVYYSHGPVTGPTALDDNIGLCGQILVGTDDHIPEQGFMGPGFLGAKRVGFDRVDVASGSMMREISNLAAVFPSILLPRSIQLHQVVEMGYIYFDTAECYTGINADGSTTYSEELVGAALKPHRHDVVIAIKYDVQHSLDGLQQVTGHTP